MLAYSENKHFRQRLIENAINNKTNFRTLIPATTLRYQIYMAIITNAVLVSTSSDKGIISKYFYNITLC